MPTGNSKDVKGKGDETPRVIAINRAFSIIGKELRRKGITFERLLKSGRRLRTALLQEEYGIVEKKTK